MHTVIHTRTLTFAFECCCVFIQLPADDITHIDPGVLANVANMTHVPWRQSTLVLVGEGQGGKTGTAHSLAGVPRLDHSSTVGIGGLTVDVTSVAVQSDSSEKAWSSTTTPVKAYVAALANEIAEAKRNKKTPQPLAQDRPLSLETHDFEEAKSPLSSRHTDDGADEVGALDSEESAAADGVQKRRKVVLDTDAIISRLFTI
jgi:hypothetical protein